MNLDGREVPAIPEPRAPPEACSGSSWCGRPRAADAGRRSPAGRDAGRRGAPRQRRLDFKTDQFGSSYAVSCVLSHLMRDTAVPPDALQTDSQALSLRLRPATSTPEWRRWGLGNARLAA